MRYRPQLIIPAWALALAATILAASSCRRDAREAEDSNDLLLTADAGDSLTLEFSSLQRTFFSALTTDRKRALSLITPAFRTFDDSTFTFLDWETPKFLGHDTVTLQKLVMRIGPDHLLADRFEVLSNRDRSVAVIGFASKTRTIITEW